MTRTIIVTPANDLDSILSYAILSKTWENPLHVYCELSNHERTKEKILTELEKGKVAFVVFADCTLNNSCMKEVSQKARPGAIVVFDHHPDVVKNCSGIVWSGLANETYPSTLRAVLDGCTAIPTEFKGNAELFALLTENEFANSARILARAVKKMIFAETTYGKQTAARLQTACDLLDPKNDKWDAIYKSIPQCIQDDENEKKWAANLAKHARTKIVNGVRASIVYLTTDAIDKVFTNLPAADALIGWKMSEDGNRVWCRVRSRNGSAQGIAKFLGCSGPLNAAAADMTLEYFFAHVMMGEKEQAQKPQKEIPPIPVTLILSKPPAKKRILRPSGLPLEKNKDVLTAIRTLKSAYKLSVSDKRVCDYFGGVDTIQNCMGQARALSTRLFGKDRPFVGYVYAVAYSVLGDYDKVDAAIEEAFSRPEAVRLIEATKPKSPCPPIRVWMLTCLVVPSAKALPGI